MNKEAKEKPQFLYHGSTAGDIEEFEPRKRFTPAGAEVPAQVYASDHPAIAAAHSFPWHSEEEIDIAMEDGVVVLKIPVQLKDRLEQNVFVYVLKSDAFKLTKEDTTGHTYHTEESVKSEKTMQFDSVTEAIEHFGGRVEIV